ncbi:MAG: ferritin-like domain-containing protein [Burkholderiaceae bacterium]|nr:ferritin-like domain-containing protein [Burkholderiaceae bacterium]
MGTKAREIVRLDIEELLRLLNKAYADEWLAYYQYWVGAKVAAGRMRGIISQELEEHAAEELNHADKLVKRMIQLGGSPLLTPEAILKESTCGYVAPTNPDTKVLLDQNIRGEQCAIETYARLLEYVRGKDPLTEKLILEILEEEVEHEEDLQAMLNDMKPPVA